MVSIKQYVLCVLVLNVICLSAMELESSGNEKVESYTEYTCDELIEFMRDEIDKRAFGVDTLPELLRRPLGSMLSYLHSSFLTQEQALQDMKVIEANIPSSHKEPVLKGLMATHWYVHYLMQALVKLKIQSLEQVTCANVDMVCISIMSEKEGLQRLVHNEVFSGIEKSFYDCAPKGVPNDIHTIVLYHDFDIVPSSLVMSIDSKYLRSDDCDGNQIIWDMEQGVKVDLSSNSIQWTPGRWVSNKQYAVIDVADKYYAVNSKGLYRNAKGFFDKDEYCTDYIGNIAVQVKRAFPAIILCKRSQKESFCCQKAYNNCKQDKGELTTLLESKSLNGIEGFPQKNLRLRIKECMDQQ